MNNVYVKSTRHKSGAWALSLRAGDESTSHEFFFSSEMEMREAMEALAQNLRAMNDWHSEVSITFTLEANEHRLTSTHSFKKQLTTGTVSRNALPLHKQGFVHEVVAEHLRSLGISVAGNIIIEKVEFS